MNVNPESSNPDSNPEASNSEPFYVKPPHTKAKKAPEPSAPPAAALVVFPLGPERPCYRAYQRAFKVDGDLDDKWWRPGIYYFFIHKEKNDDGKWVETFVDLWFLSWLEVAAIVRTASNKEHSYLVKYLAHGERNERQLVLPQASLLGRADDAFKLLRGCGVTVLNKHLKTVRSYLDEQHLNFSAAKPDQFWTSSKTIGWYSKETFLLPNEIIGQRVGVCFAGNTEGALYGTAGTYEKWRESVAALCRGNDYLVFALSSSFAGPLLKWVGITGGGVHLYGDSTVGKSTSQYVAVSSWAPPSFMAPWRTTTNGLEGQAACRCDTFMALDDSHQADPKTLDAAIYMLVNGQPKLRMNRDSSVKEIQIWRVFVLSSGERSLETHIGSASRIEHKAGQAMRLVDVRVEGATHGLFDDLHGYADGKVFSEKLVQNCSKHYGHAAPMFIRVLITNLPVIDLSLKLSAKYQQFGQNLSAQEGRVARAFALVALAGELAIEWKIVPWTAGEALAASMNIFQRWRESQPQSAKSREHEQIVRELSDFIETHGSSRFSDIDWKAGYNHWGGEETEPVVYERAGWYETNGSNERMFLFTAGGLKAATAGFDFRRVIQALEEAGAFYETGSKEKAKKRRTPEKQEIKLYHIDPEKLRA